MSTKDFVPLSEEVQMQTTGPLPKPVMRKVVIESPYAGDIVKHLDYAKAAMVDSLQRGEAPIASHLIYPQVLFDSIKAQRDLGINAGLAWMRSCDLVAVYNDLGISYGMHKAIEFAESINKPIEYRFIGDSNEQGNQCKGTAHRP